MTVMQREGRDSLRLVCTWSTWVREQEESAFGVTNLQALISIL
jgi:hypothetical protein